jgi:hypothetical protein
VQVPEIVFPEEAMTPREEVTQELRQAWVEAPPLIERAETMAVRTPEDKRLAIDTLGQMKKLVDRLKPVRKRHAGPYFRLGEAVEGFYDAILDPLKTGIDGLKRRYEFRIEEERLEAEKIAREQRAREETARKEQERLAAEDRDRRAKEAREAAEKEAREAGNLTPAEVQEYADVAAQEAQEAAPAPVKVLSRPTPGPPPKTVRASGRSGTVNDLTTVAIHDFPALATWAVQTGRFELLEAKEKLIRDLHDAGVKEVPGVTFGKKANLAITAPK